MRFIEFPERPAASLAAARLISHQLSSCLSDQERCSIVVSGGSTPGDCLKQLSDTPLEWSKVTVVPSDERWVPADHPDSNEGLIRNSLLQGKATNANFLALYHNGIDTEEFLPQLRFELGGLSLPFAAVLLGMGEDGHFASLFPDFAGLKEALNPLGKAPCMMVKTAGSPHQRISLCLSLLLKTRHVIMLMFGDKKRVVFEEAAAGNSNYPIEALLEHHAGPLTVLWAS